MCHKPKIRLSSYDSLPDHIVLSISLTLILLRPQPLSIPDLIGNMENIIKHVPYPLAMKPLYSIRIHPSMHLGYVTPCLCSVLLLI